MDNQVIVLSDNSDDDVTAVPHPTHPPGKVIAKTQPVELPPVPVPSDDICDDEIQITSFTNIKSRDGKNVLNASSQTRTELECVGERQGIRALRDYPHFRYQCDIHPFKKVRSRQKEAYCKRCFCYICDVLASECTKWSVHCKVIDSPKYRKERDAVLRERKRRELSTDEGRCTMLKRFTTPQFVNDTQYELLVELPNEEEEFEDDGCPHSASDEDQASLPVGFDHGHVMQSLQRVRVGGKGSKLERVVDLDPQTRTYFTFHRGASAYEDLL